MNWLPIKTAPTKADWLSRRLYDRAMVGNWHQPTDEDGKPYVPGQWSWVQVVSLTSSGWHVWSSGFAGWHGTATFPVHNNATHWMPLPPLSQREEHK